MAETLVWVQENNINDLTELNDLCKTAQANAQAAYERLSQAEDELYKTNELDSLCGAVPFYKRGSAAIYESNSQEKIPCRAFQEIGMPMQNP